MEEAQNELDDLWVLSAIVPVICYMMTASFLLYVLNFDYELPGNEKVGILMAFFTFSVVLACVYVQMLKKFRSCKNILKEKRPEEARLEEPNVGCSENSTGEEKETDSSKSLVRFSSCVQRHSFSVQSQEEFSYRCDSATSAPDAFPSGGLCLSETDIKCTELKNPNGASSESPDEIPVILHNCVKDLGDIIEHVRLLNDVYFQSIEGTAYDKENSTTAVGSSDVVETIEDTAFDKENSTTVAGSSDVTEHGESPNHAHVETIEDTAFDKENSTTAVGSSDVVETIEDAAFEKENSTTAVGSSDVTEHGELPNHAHGETIEDTAVAIESSMTTVEERNSNSKFMEEEKSLQCKLQSTDNFEKLTDASENNSSIPPDMSQDLDNVQKPIEDIKIDSRKQNPVRRFGFRKILSENLCPYILNVSEDAIQEFQSKPGITVIDGPESFLIKIPSHEHQLHPVKNPNPELDMGEEKISLWFYKPKPPVILTVAPKVTVKRRIPKLPMRPYLEKFTMSQLKYQRTNSMKRYVTLISKREPTISKTMPTMSKKTPISVNELLISMNKSLITDMEKIYMNKSSITDMEKLSVSINGPLISKFEQTDYEKFASVLKKCRSYCLAHPEMLRKYFQKPAQPIFPKWETHTFPSLYIAEKNQGDNTDASKTPKKI